MRGVTKGEKFYNGNVCLEEDCGGFWLRIEDDAGSYLEALPVTEEELPRIKEVIEQWEFKNKYEKSKD